jgi:hypothetical protein
VDRTSLDCASWTYPAPVSTPLDSISGTPTSPTSACLDSTLVRMARSAQHLKRKEAAGSAQMSLNPCVRCLAHYASDFGSEDCRQCSFTMDQLLLKNASFQTSMVDENPNAALLNRCGPCLDKNQPCYEVSFVQSGPFWAQSEPDSLDTFQSLP